MIYQKSSTTLNSSKSCWERDDDEKNEQEKIFKEHLILILEAQPSQPFAQTDQNPDALFFLIPIPNRKQIFFYDKPPSIPPSTKADKYQGDKKDVL